MTRRRPEAEVEYICFDCEESWKIEGRFDSEGNFVPNDEDDTMCPECGCIDNEWT